MRTAAVTLLLLVGLFLTVAIPVYNDHRIQDVTRVGFRLGIDVADRAIASSPGEGREVADGASLLPDNEKTLPEYIAQIRLTKDGLVDVIFKSPGELAGKAIRIRTTRKDGKFVRECRGQGIGEKFLPLTCRADYGPFEIEGPAGSTTSLGSK